MEIQVLITLLLLALVAVVGFVLLFRRHKKDKAFEKKGVVFFSITNFLLFGLFGLTALLDTPDIAGLYNSFQAVAILAGLVYVWLLFTVFDWADQRKYFSESVFILLQTVIGTLGFIVSFWAIDQFFGYQNSRAPTLAKAMLWLPVPYLLYRTYHLVREIPFRTYKAWFFPERLPPKINLSSQNSIYVYMKLHRSLSGGGAPLERRSRMPKDAPFGEFFENFVNDYNKENPQAPIQDLRDDKQGRPIGWVFKCSATPRGRRKTIDPAEQTTTQIWEGDFVNAQRVWMKKEHAVPASTISFPGKNSEEDGEDSIIIIEEK